MRRILLAGAVASALSLGGCVPPPRTAPPPPAASPAVQVPRFVPPGATPRPPRLLVDRILALGAGFDGQVGIAVRDVQAGWVVAWQGSRPFPQQSVSKLWVAITFLSQVDRGQQRLDQPVTVTRADLTLFHQPIRAEIGPSGLVTTPRDLLTRAMTRSDNTANDVLLRLAGGPAAVNAMLAANGLSGIRFGPGERLLQAYTAGLVWDPSMAIGSGFETARARLSPAARQAALDRYLADPIDGASAEGITAGLAALRKGSLLSPGSTQLLLSLMGASRTGPQRLKGGLADGWAAAHKTGTGQDLGTLGTGYNDVALMTAPDGRTYAVAVLIGATRQPIWARMQLMQAVTRTVIAAHAVAEKP